MPDNLISIATLSHLSGAVLYLFLSLLLLAVWRGRPLASMLLAGCFISALWFAGMAYQTSTQQISLRVVQVLELCRNLSWYVFLLYLLNIAFSGDQTSLRRLSIVKLILYGITVSLMALLLFQNSLQNINPGLLPGTGTYLLGHVLMALGGLLLVEWLYRNTHPDHRWSIKFLCLSLGGLYSYDFYLYSDALLFRQIDADLWHARGAINALTVPLLAIAIARNREWSVRLFVSRHVVFHTTTFLAAGGYLLLMASAGFYIRRYGGEWGEVLQTVFVFASIMFLLGLLFSGRIRKQLKIFLNKHFFANKYEYGKEWLRFTETLSATDSGEPITRKIIRAIAQVVESPGGVLWMARDDGDYSPQANWVMAMPEKISESGHSDFILFLEDREWVINLDEFRIDPAAYGRLVLPDWLLGEPRALLVIPLLQSHQLLGFVVLARPTDKELDFNWEDRDLLKTVGRQSASYLAIDNLSNKLAEAKQFEAFNRLSAFVVHDLKNVVAQLSLVTRNAKKHLHNQAFVEDAMLTVENSVNKMNRMLGQLRKEQSSMGNIRKVSIAGILGEVVEKCSANLPVPVIDDDSLDATVAVDLDRFEAVLQHIVQNAQDATADDGEVRIRVSANGTEILLDVSDTGSGMDATFIEKYLFRPFYTTKGNAGMGIGAYECREFVQGAGGQIVVESTPGKGTKFSIILPVATRADAETGVAVV